MQKLSLFQVVTGQLLKSSEDVDDINALKDFGKRISPIKHNKDLLTEETTADKLKRPIDLPVVRFRNDTTKTNTTPKPKPIDLPVVHQKKKVAVKRRVVNRRKPDNSESILPAESGRGGVGFGDDLAYQNVDGEVHGKGKSPKSRGNFMEFMKRGQRQSHMEDMAHAHIENLSVNCGPRGIAVTLKFADRFDGVVYSKGYFNDPRCT